jgi:hypothetical protein
MIETTRPILNLPWAYQMWGSILGSDGCGKTHAKEHIRARSSDSIPDVGCGPGSMVPCRPRLENVGFNANPNYIPQVQRRFPVAHFTINRVNEYKFDDLESVQLFRMARRTRKPQGRLNTLEGVWVPSQSRFAKFLPRRDRGRFVRHGGENVALASTSFSTVTVPHETLRIPYSHLILKCGR